MSLDAINCGSFIATLTKELVAQKLADPGGETTPGGAHPIPQISSVVIKALHGNGGICYIGKSGVEPAFGFELEKGESVSLDIQTWRNIYWNGTKTGDKLCVFFVGS